MWAQPDMARRHFDFLRETLGELDLALRGLGAPLVIRVGDAVLSLRSCARTMRSLKSTHIRKPGMAGRMRVTARLTPGRDLPVSELSNICSMACIAV